MSSINLARSSFPSLKPLKALILVNPIVDNIVIGAYVIILGAPIAIAGGAIVNSRVNGASIIMGGGGSIVFFKEVVIEIYGSLSIGEEGILIGSISSVELSSTRLFLSKLIKNFSRERKRLATILY